MSDRNGARIWPPTIPPFWDRTMGARARERAGASARAGARATARWLPGGDDMRTCDGKGARAVDKHQRNIARHMSAQRPRHIFHKPPHPSPPSPLPPHTHTQKHVCAPERAHTFPRWRAHEVSSKSTLVRRRGLARLRPKSRVTHSTHDLTTNYELRTTNY